MPLVEALSRISDIESTISQLNQQPLPTSTLLNTAATRQSAAAFTASLSRASSAPTEKLGTDAGSTIKAKPTDDSTPTTGDVTGADIVRDAKKYLGVPYVFGGESKSGMDCSGLVQTVLKDLGIKSPRLVHEQRKIGKEVGKLSHARPGDLIVTNNSEHIVIYAGHGMVIHAPYPGRKVSLQKNWLTDSQIMTIRRVAHPKPAVVKPATTTIGTDSSSALTGTALTGTALTGTAAADAATQAAAAKSIAEMPDLTTILNSLDSASGSSASGNSASGLDSSPSSATTSSGSAIRPSTADSSVSDLIAAAQLKLLTGTTP